MRWCRRTDGKRVLTDHVLHKITRTSLMFSLDSASSSHWTLPPLLKFVAMYVKVCLAISIIKWMMEHTSVAKSLLCKGAIELCLVTKSLHATSHCLIKPYDLIFQTEKHNCGNWTAIHFFFLRCKMNLYCPSWLTTVEYQPKIHGWHST